MLGKVRSGEYRHEDLVAEFHALSLFFSCVYIDITSKYSFIHYNSTRLVFYNFCLRWLDQLETTMGPKRDLNSRIPYII